ncbi:MAG: coenzyme F420-0:L-glutamate ligase [Clostridia bacterium]|nr:coenzyme F420-0:L-glutamate ligase [Clostridia bacterium]
MAIWYEGNRNNEQNKREQNGVVYYIRGVREVENVRYERYGVKTHFIQKGEDLTEVLRRYVLPLYQEGDVVTLGEKVVSMCQGNIVTMDEVKVGFWAKFLSKFAYRSATGTGLSEPYKMQLTIDMKGLPLVLWASFCSAVGKLFGKRGVFFKILGREVAGIDGFYPHSQFDTYKTTAVLSTTDPVGVCKEVYEKLGISCVLVDANDIDVEVLGKSPDLAEVADANLAERIRDNPAGQDDELTPFILIRDIGDDEAEEFVPLVAIEKPADH